MTELRAELIPEPHCLLMKNEQHQGCILLNRCPECQKRVGRYFASPLQLQALMYLVSSKHSEPTHF